MLKTFTFQSVEATPTNKLMMMPDSTDAFYNCYSPVMKEPVSFVLHWVRLAVTSVS